MRYLCLLIMLIVGCREDRGESFMLPHFKLIDFTYSSMWNYSVSIQIRSDGKYLIKKRDNGISWFAGRLLAKDLLSLDSSALRIQKCECNDRYEEANISDAPGFEMVFISNNFDIVRKSVYGSSAPASLRFFKQQIMRLIDVADSRRVDTIASFLSTHDLVPIQIDTFIIPPSRMN